jgi:hypothetical protein
MNFWLVGAAAALVCIGATHSAMGERRIFLPWASVPPRDVARHHQVILRACWHLPTLLGGGMAAVVFLLADGAAAAPWRAVLGALALAVGASGVLVALATRGRHHGGTALLATSVLIVLGQWQASAP